MLNSAVTVLPNPPGAVLFNLSLFQAGSEKVLDRIVPGQKGIYAWFRSFNFRTDPEEFEIDLINAIDSPKFQQRTGAIAPYYEVSIGSKSTFSRNKRKALSQAINDEEFADSLRFCLNWSILLQAPLYIGKSADLKERISQHLKSGSDLRGRLNNAHINLDSCQLLIIPLGAQQTITTNESSHESAASTQSLMTLPDKEWADEDLFEEIFSRLFNPSFTIRLG